ncbi:MAG: hypothetical protein Q8Q02_16385 [Nocardioides sp.]|nr:hypothetical protein [Nocardioides sp.]
MGRLTGRSPRVVARESSLPAGYGTGNVVVTLDGRTRTVTLAEGCARTVFRRLDPGVYDV